MDEKKREREREKREGKSLYTPLNYHPIDHVSPNFQLKQCHLKTTKKLSMSYKDQQKDKNDLTIF
jgi:hypothetical protein